MEEESLDFPPQRTVVALNTPEEITQLVCLLENISAELGWQPGAQLRSFADQSVHFAAYIDGTLAGGLQLVSAKEGSTLPCELVWPEVQLPKPSETAHVAILALRPEYRGSTQLLWPLCVALWRYCIAHRLSAISLEVTPKTYQLYKRLGWPLEIIGELRRHWGEDCFLCRIGVVEVAGMMVMRATRSSSYRSIVQMLSLPLEAPAMLHHT